MVCMYRVLKFLLAIIPIHSLLISPTRRFTRSSSISSLFADSENEIRYKSGNEYKVIKINSAKRKLESLAWPTDGRDMLPYKLLDIESTSPSLGAYLLPGDLGCGDVLTLSGIRLKVERVRFQYKFESGSFRVTNKVLEVKKLRSNSSLTKSAKQDDDLPLQNDNDGRRNFLKVLASAAAIMSPLAQAPAPAFAVQLDLDEAPPELIRRFNRDVSERSKRALRKTRECF